MSEENVSIYTSEVTSLTVPRSALREESLLTIRASGVLDGNYPTIILSGIPGTVAEGAGGSNIKTVDLLTTQSINTASSLDA